MTIYLARHGTTEWNRAGRIQGRTDIRLDAEGRELARLSGENLAARGITFKYVFSSPLTRSLETARLLAPYAQPVPDDRLIELGFGEFEGRDIEEMLNDADCTFRFFKKDAVRYDEEVRALKLSAEPLTGLYMRVSDFMKSVIEPVILADDTPDLNILICGHGALNRAVLMYFNGTGDLNHYWDNGVQANCGVAKVTCKKDGAGNISYTVIDPCILYYDPALIPEYPL